jgi:hypothetical protein
MQANRASYRRRIDTAVVTPLLSLIDAIPLGFNSALASASVSQPHDSGVGWQ